MCIWLSVFISFYLYLCICLPMSICPSIYIKTKEFIHSFVYLSTCPLSISHLSYLLMSSYALLHLHIYLSVCLSHTHPYTQTHTHLHTCPLSPAAPGRDEWACAGYGGLRHVSWKWLRLTGSCVVRVVQVVPTLPPPPMSTHDHAPRSVSTLSNFSVLRTWRVRGSTCSRHAVLQTHNREEKNNT